MNLQYPKSESGLTWKIKFIYERANMLSSHPKRNYLKTESKCVTGGGAVGSTEPWWQIAIPVEAGKTFCGVYLSEKQTNWVFHKPGQLPNMLAMKNTTEQTPQTYF